MYANMMLVAAEVAALSQIAVGSNPHPQDVLRKSQQALASLGSVSYHAECYFAISAENRRPIFSGEVACKRADDGALWIWIDWPLRVTAPTTGTSDPRRFRAHFRNGQGVYYEPGSEEEESYLSKSESALMRFEMWECLILSNSLSFEEEIQDAPEFKRQVSVNGVDCYVIRTRHGRFQFDDWYVGISDSIPRRLDHYSRSRPNGATICELSDLQLNPPLDGRDLSVPPLQNLAVKAESEFTRELVGARTEVQHTVPPSWLKVPKWEEAVELDLAVSLWVQKRAAALALHTSDDIGLKVELEGAARAAKEHLWDAPRTESTFGLAPGSLRTFDGGLNAIHYLAALGMDKEIAELAESSVPNGLLQRDSFGHSPIDYAAIYGRPSVIMTLWSQDGFSSSIAGAQSLRLAAAMGQHDVLRLLLEKGVEANEADEQGITALEYALESGDDDTISALLVKVKAPRGEGSVERLPLKDFFRPVLTAIRNKRCDILRNLAKYIDLTMPLKAGEIGLFSGESAKSDTVNLLHYAAANGDKAIVEFLISEIHIGAASFDDHGRPPLFFARAGEVAEALIAADSSLIEHTDEFECSAAHYLASGNSPQALQLILDKAPSLVNRKDKHGSLPIEYAVYACADKTVSVLIEAGASTEMRVRDNTNIMSGVVDRVALTALGESVGQSVQSDKTTLLHMAARFGCAETTEALLNAGVPGDALDDCGRTPLIVAFVHDRWDLVKWLLEAKIGRLQTSIDRKSLDRINVNQKTESGCLAIHFAAAAGRQDLVDLLIEVGADINERVAPSFGHGVRSIEWLRGCGLGLAAGATPLDLARMGKHWKVADGLKKRGAVSGLGN